MFLALHFSIFGFLVSWIDIKTHRIPRQTIYLGVFALAPFHNFALWCDFLLISMIAHLIYFTSKGAIGYGDVRLVPIFVFYSALQIPAFLIIIFALLCMLAFLARTSRSNSVAAAPFLFFAYLIANEFAVSLR